MIASSPITPATVYSVTNWNALFENNRSRKMENARWVPIPNRHDGERYSRVMQHKQAAQLFAAWILILEVASKCQPRGMLVRADGSPYDADGLALKTRAPASWFALALPYFAGNRWLSAQVPEGVSFAPSTHEPDTQLPLACAQPAIEGKEEKGRNGKEKEGRETGSVSPADVEPDLQTRMLSINALFHRREGTRWSAKEFDALREAGVVESLAVDFEEEMRVLSAYYGATAEQLQEHWRAKPGDDFRRRDLLTLLNNWPGEVDRARAAAHWLAKKSDERDRGRL